MARCLCDVRKFLAIYAAEQGNFGVSFARKYTDKVDMNFRQIVTTLGSNSIYKRRVCDVLHSLPIAPA